MSGNVNENDQSLDELEDIDVESDSGETDSTDLDSNAHTDENGEFKLRTLRQLNHLSLTQWLEFHKLSNLLPILKEHCGIDKIQLLCNLNSNDDITEVCDIFKQQKVSISNRLSFKAAITSLCTDYASLNQKKVQQYRNNASNGTINGNLNNSSMGSQTSGSNSSNNNNNNNNNSNIMSNGEFGIKKEDMGGFAGSQTILMTEEQQMEYGNLLQLLEKVRGNFKKIFDFQNVSEARQNDVNKDIDTIFDEFDELLAKKRDELKENLRLMHTHYRVSLHKLDTKYVQFIKDITATQDSCKQAWIINCHNFDEVLLRRSNQKKNQDVMKKLKKTIEEHEHCPEISSFSDSLNIDGHFKPIVEFIEQLRNESLEAIGQQLTLKNDKITRIKEMLAQKQKELAAQQNQETPGNDNNSNNNNSNDITIKTEPGMRINENNNDNSNSNNNSNNNNNNDNSMDNNESNDVISSNLGKRSLDSMNNETKENNDCEGNNSNNSNAAEDASGTPPARKRQRLSVASGVSSNISTTAEDGSFASNTSNGSVRIINTNNSNSNDNSANNNLSSNGSNGAIGNNGSNEGESNNVVNNGNDPTMPGLEFKDCFLSLQDAMKLKIGDNIDHRDDVGKFVFATIIDKKESENKVNVHYEGWDPKWDKWSDYSKELNKFAKPKSISERQRYRLHEVKPDTYLLAKVPHATPQDTFTKVLVKRVDEQSGQVQVYYRTDNGTKQRMHWLHLDNTDEVQRVVS